TRREILQVMATLGLGVAAVPLIGRQAAGAPKLDVFTWGGYDVPEAIPQYIAKHGGPPNFSLFATEEEALQKMLAGFEPDLAHPCHYNIKRWKDAGILQPFDVAKVPEYQNIWERLRTIPETSFDGAVYFMPWDAGTSSIAYRTDLVDPADVADPSWGLLFNEKYKGKLSMYDTDTTFIEIAARIMGMYGDYRHFTDEQLAQIKPMLVKQRDLMKFYWSDQATMEQAMAAGEIVAAYAWSGSYAVLKGQGVPVAYMVPKEGILGYSCGLVRNSKSAGDEGAVYDFINALLDPESGKWLIEQSGYFHSNKRTYKIVDPAVLSNMGASDPEATFSSLAIEPEPEEPYRSKYIEFINNIKAGL
ncbi:MAG: ABC transporter substrate-binding protein, partial [Dongiaceae bacterium]